MNKNLQAFARYLKLSQIHLFLWLIVASFLASSVVFKNGGVSNYGNHYSTVIFYSLAFLGAAIYVYKAANILQLINKRFKNLVLCLKVLSILLALVFITTFPRRFGNIYSVIHDDISKVLFGYEFLLAIWLVYKMRSLESILYTLIMAVGSIIALLSSMHILHQMFVGQITGAFGFGLLAVYVLPKLVAKTARQ